LLRNVGALYDELGEYQKALEYDQQALAIQQKINEPRAAAITLSNMGSTAREMDEADAQQKARDYLRESLQIFEAIGDRENKARVLGNLASVEILLGENQKALDHLTQSLSFSRETGDRFGECVSYAYLGDLYASLHEPQKALDYYQQSLKLSRDLKKENIEAAALGHMAKLAYSRGQLKEAQTRIEQAIKVIESVRAGVAGRELRTSYFTKVWEYYSFYIGALMQLHKQQPGEGYAAAALQASEHARARSLLELLAESHADIHQGVAPALLERERSLRQKLTARAALHLRLPPNSEQATKAAQEIEVLNLEHQNVEAQIRAASPHYAALTQPQRITLAEIQQLLDSETVLLEYALGRDRGYLWVVTPTTIKSFELPKRITIEDAAKKLLAVLTVPRGQRTGETLAQQRTRTAELDAKTQTVAAELSQMLLAPVAAQLGKKRLVIVGDGVLQYVPFAALPKPGAAAQVRGASSKRSSGGTPLIVDHEIISLPSASTIALLRRELAGRKPAPKVLAALADPVFSEAEVDERLKEAARAAQRSASAQSKPPLALPSAQTRAIQALLDASAGGSEPRLRLPRLRASGEEALTIAKLAPPGKSKVALGFAANYATATSPELAEYRHLLFATHGWLDDKHPELSGILPSLVDEQKQEQNGLLRLGEVYNLRLQAEVVTLSACQTALGKDVRGEGLVGLTRGFMYAGVARVVASLWKVEEEGTKELMIRFYRGMLNQQLRPAAALRQAQLSMLRQPEWRSPYYWSAFILQGEWR
jgi:CHAT domain-containing protein